MISEVLDQLEAMAASATPAHLAAVARDALPELIAQLRRALGHIRTLETRVTRLRGEVEAERERAMRAASVYLACGERALRYPSISPEYLALKAERDRWKLLAESASAQCLTAEARRGRRRAR